MRRALRNLIDTAARQRVSRWVLVVVSTALASIFADEPLFAALVPYALWVAFAAVLTWTIALAN